QTVDGARVCRSPRLSPPRQQHTILVVWREGAGVGVVVVVVVVAAVCPEIWRQYHTTVSIILQEFCSYNLEPSEKIRNSKM
ncbi:unnamed protein product, partial [Tetraodon nigroviridis]